MLPMTDASTSMPAGILQGNNQLLSVFGNNKVQAFVPFTPELPIEPRVMRNMGDGVESVVMIAGIGDIFAKPYREQFEPGRESSLSVDLMREIDRRGTDAVLESQNVILNPVTNPEYAAEALRWLGKSDHEPSRRMRRLVLESALSHINPDVRDAAILGLASMEDAEAIPALDAAMKREPFSSMKESFKQALDDLRGE